MDAVPGALAVGQLVYDLCNRLKKFKDDWKNAPEDLEKLRDKLDFYKQQLTGIDGLPKGLLKGLEKAETELTELEVQMKKGRLSKFRLFWFVDGMISDLERDVEEISKILNPGDFDLALRAWKEGQPAKPRIWNNGDLYVPIENSQSAVIAAVEDVNGPPIILLHGGVGKGKSTLAKYVWKLYTEPTKREKTFGHTIMVPCDGELDRTKTQREILQRLAPRDEKDVADTRIEDAFHSFLSHNKTLVILDQVSDPRFLLGMAQAAEGCQYKYLVTSQKSNLCHSFEERSKLIKMGEATKDEARRILANLVGLKDKKIPPNLQGLADSMIGKVGRNPLALGCLAANMATSGNKADLQRVWNDDDNESLRILLQSSEKKFVLGQNLDTRPRSLWGAMKLCFESLEAREAENILFFIYASKGASLPEEVLRILYEQITTGWSSFGRAREELSMRELLKSSPHGLELYASLESKPDDQKQHVKYKAWSLPPLVKLYMKHRVAHKKKFFESMIDSLVRASKVEPDSRGQPSKTTGASDATTSASPAPRSEKAKVAIVLCALYFHRAHPDESQVVNKAVARVCSESPTIGPSEQIDERRKAVEPIIWLIDQPKKDKEWTESDVDHARKSFLKYTCEHRLDNDGISALLKLTTRNPRAQLAVLKALLSIFETETVPLLSWQNPDIPEALKQFLSSKEKSRIKDTASKILECIVKSQVTFLSQDEKPDWQQMAGWTLKTLASARSQWMKTKIVDQNRALPDLVRLLNNDKLSTTARKQAAEAFRNLADTHEMSIKEKIVNERDALAGLVTALFVDGDSRLQGAAAGALRTVASGKGNSFCLDAIVREKNAVPGLVKCLLQQDDTGLQGLAAGALRTLVSGRDAIKAELVKTDKRLLPVLANLLSEAQESKLLKSIAGTLSYLAASEDDSLKKKIVRTPNVIPGLVKVLSERNETSLREEAAGALNNLAGTADESVRVIIKNHEGLLNALRKASESKKGNSGLGKQAEEALKNLERGHRRDR